jgi:hypothetical protein
MKLLEMIIPAAQAQSRSSLDIGDFNFLKLYGETGGAVSNFNTLFGNIVGWVLTIAAIVAFFYLIVSGFQYITAGGDAAKAQTARQGIINALIGIVVILISWVVLRYVGTQFSGR